MERRDKFSILIEPTELIHRTIHKFKTKQKNVAVERRQTSNAVILGDNIIGPIYVEQHLTGSI